jgi:hypothetical protein
MQVMARKLVSRTELAKILNDRIQQLPEGRGRSITAEHLLSLRSPSPSGRNWFPRIDMELSFPALLQVFRKAQDEFNLEEEVEDSASAQTPKATGPFVYLLYIDAKRSGATE